MRRRRRGGEKGAEISMKINAGLFTTVLGSNQCCVFCVLFFLSLCLSQCDFNEDFSVSYVLLNLMYSLTDQGFSSLKKW